MIISRSDEANFPEFDSVKKAREYFKNRYGDKYKPGHSVELSDDLLCYFDEVEFQSLQILEYGDGTVSIHIVY